MRLFVAVLIGLVVGETDSCLAAADTENKKQLTIDDTAVYAEEIKEERCDLDGDGVEELIQITWQSGGSDKPIRVKAFRGDKLLQTLGPVMDGIQSNYALKDTDDDGRPELLIWSGLWDFRLPGENGLGEQEYEGHSASHRYVVATYKWMRDAFWVWGIYTTKKKYDPYPENVPE